MLELVAAAKEDGWAFVRRESELLLVKPPYDRKSLLPVDDDTLQRAVTAHGFEPVPEKRFQDWAALLKYLREELASRPRPFGGFTDEDLGSELLDDAPREILATLLRRVDAELLPKGELAAAVRLLSAISKAKATVEDRDLLKACLGMQERCANAALQKGVQRVELTTEAVIRRFPSVSKRYNANSVAGLARGIARDHQILKLGAA